MSEFGYSDQKSKNIITSLTNVIRIRISFQMKYFFSLLMANNRRFASDETNNRITLTSNVITKQVHMFISVVSSA